MLKMNFWITNLLMPGDPESVPIATPHGSWQFVKMPEFARNSAAIRGATVPRPAMMPVAETYYLQDTAGADDVRRFVDRSKVVNVCEVKVSLQRLTPTLDQKISKKS
ncbi:hypothetical protein K7N18_25330 [Burkholderia arboris]|uniref:hypothetical protein n=1 Tax=Burkholderia arboris TaxID=488730 RepID=UPI001CA41269|nr:hypothetical protein [Burkholderia arboris]MBY8608152.1 hypothetical protein [Burkholderia arboris]